MPEDYEDKIPPSYYTRYYTSPSERYFSSLIHMQKALGAQPAQREDLFDKMLTPADLKILEGMKIKL